MEKTEAKGEGRGTADGKREAIRRAAAARGAAFLETTGDSMAPLLRRGDRVGLVPVAPGALRVGDLIAYDDDGKTVCHRFLGWEVRGGTRWARQKGDNLSSGSRLAPEAILGRVAVVDCAGRMVRLDRLLPRLAQAAVGRYLSLFALEAAGTPLRRRLQWLVVRPLARIVRRWG